MKIRLFSGKLLISLIAFLLFASSELPSSSKAEDGFWLTRSQSGLEQLWSGVLGCTESTDSFAIRNRFNDSEDTNSGAPSTGASIDYSECGKRALRNTSSRILVDTIEDAVRSGGVALFSEHFRLDSSVGWVFGEDVTGEIDAVIPLFSRERSNGTGQALFLQPGAVFWSGLESEDRIDANLGLAYRQHLAPDIVAGGSIFYDYDFKREHQRIGIGADLQRGALHAALNYYHPLNEWQEGRTEYEEQPLQGADFRLGLAWSRVRLDAGVGVWRFEGEEEESTKWRPSFEFGAGYLIYPGVFLQGGYERHDSDDSLDSRWNAELAFRFSLPGLQGVKSYETMAQANLWEPVEREKRILYEEREAVPPVRLSAPTGADGAELTSLPEEGDTITIVGNLEALSVPVMLELVIDEEASSADLGDDFRYGHKVYELDAATGEQSAPSDATNCPAARCEMMIPARVTRFDVEIEILSDSVAREIPEEIVLEVEVPEEYQRMVRGGARTVGIHAHGNTVQFTEAMSTLDENGGMVDVAVNANLASPSPITLNVTATSTDAVQGRDYTFPSGSLTIPANPDGEITSASLRLTGINNDRGEGSKTITLTIPDQSLPTGWTFGTQTTHTVTLQDDDLAIFFTDATPGRVDEPASNQSVAVTVGITQAPVADITVNVAVDTSASTAQASDYSFTTTPLTFSMGSTTPQTATLMINHDMDPEGDETVVLTLADDSTNSRDAEGSGFSLGSPHIVTIPANDNTVGFASNAVATLGENGGTARVEVSMDNPAPRDITLNVTATDDAATVMIGRDYRISTRSLTIPRGQTTGTITLTGINNERGEGSKDIDLTLSVVGNLPNGWAEGDLEHKVTLLDDDLSVSFTSTTRSRVEEPASDQSVTIEVGITQAPSAEIKVMLAADTSASSAERGTGKDYTFTDVELTFSVSSTASQTATLMVLHDTVAENDETIVLTLNEVGGSLTTGGNNFSLGGNHTITIPANDNTVGFASNAVATLNENGGTANVEVSISNPAPADITLNVSVDTATSTATEGTDFTLSPSTLTISRGNTTGTITLTGIDDRLSEGSEDIDLTLSVVGNLPNGWAEGDLEHEVTLQDDDLSIFFVTSGMDAIPSTEEEPETGGTPVTITVGITQAPTAEIKVMVEADTSSTATVGDGDYTLTGAELTFPMNSTASQTATLTVLQDSAAEAEDETIVLTLSEVSGLTTGGNNFSLGGNHTITIPKNGNTVAFASGTSTLTEGASTTTVVTVNVDEPAPEDIVLDITTSGTATEGGTKPDYAIDSKSLTIQAGQSSGTITIRGREDDDGEGDETIMLEISLPQGSSLPDGWALGMQTTHTVTIKDNDLSIFFITDPSADPTTPSEVVEEPAGTALQPKSKTVTIAVGITEAPTAELKVRVAAGGTGQTAVPGSNSTEDYVFGGETLTFPSGSTATQTTTLTLVNANENETDETIVLTLDDDSTTQAARIAGGFSLGAPHTITIPAHDNTVSFGAERSTLVEGAGTPTMIPVNVEHPAPVDITLDVEVLTASTATENTDFTIDPKSLTIPAGELTRPITLTGMDDNRIEGNETIMLRIRLPQGSSLPDGWDFGRVTTHEVTLQDDDLRISFADATPSEEEEPASGSTSVTITVDINHAPDADIMVRVAAGGTGETASPSGMNPDYTFAGAPLTFPSGSTASQTATLMVRQDSEAEVENETIVLTLAGVGTSLADEGQGFVLGDSHTITIPANGNTVSFASNASTIVEGDSTTGEVEVTVNINEPASEDITLNITTSGTATETGAMADYTIDTKSLTIDAGESSGKITITSNDDDRAEGDETIMLEISEPSGSPWPVGWELGAQTTHEVTLQDDDLRISFVPDTDPSVTPHTPSSVDEPASDQSVTIAVGINHAPTAEIKVMVEADMVNSSADQGTGMDYTFTAAELTFPAGSTASQTATLMVLHDDTPEDAETIFLTLTEVSGLTTGGNNFSLGGSYTITIPGNDRIVSFASNAATTLTEGVGTMTEVTVEVTPSAPADIMVDVAVTGTALENTDFTIDSKSLTIPAGETSGKITLRGRDDNTVEGDETIVLEISEPSGSPWPNGWVPGMRTTHTVTLKDDDLSIVFDTSTGNTPNEVEEPASDQTVMVVVDIGRAPTTPVKVTVGVDTVASTAMSGTDYTFTDTELTFPVNSDASQSVPLVILHDEDPEDEETIVLTLSDPDGTLATEGSGFMLGAEHTIRIPKNDTRTVEFSEASSQHREGSTRVRTSVALVPGYSDDIKVGVRRLPGSTAIAGTDYTDNIPQTITIPMAPTSLASSEFISINVIDDNDDEEEKTLILEIFNPSGADAWPAGLEPGEITVHTFTIHDNDVPANTIGFEVGRSRRTGDEGDNFVEIRLEVAASLPSATDVNIAIAVDGVSNPSGYGLSVVDDFFGPQPLTGNVVTIDAGITSVLLYFEIPEDNTNTIDETITLTLTKGANFPSGWDLGSANSPTTWTITANDND